jgi:hypothetical protein
MALVMFILSCIWILWVLFFHKWQKQTLFFVRKDSFNSIGDASLNLELPLAMVVSTLGIYICIIQLGAIEILQYCCLFVLVCAKG